MNHYGEMARNHDRTHHPDRYATISDPEAHYQALGEGTQTAVTDLRDQILGPRRKKESMDGFRTRSHQALRQAEELVLDELLTTTATDQDHTDGETTALHALNDRLSRLATSWSDPTEQRP